MTDKFSFADDQQARHELAELLKQFADAPLVQGFPFIEKDGKACHGLARLAADVRNVRKVDFRAANWNW
jgi:hypothetical protein